MDGQSPPRHLRKSTKEWWNSIVTTFELESHHLHLLRLACESLDRLTEARTIIKKEGMVYRNAAGEPRPHPACKVEIDNKTMFARLLREMSLDVSQPGEARPPAISGNAYLKRG